MNAYSKLWGSISLLIGGVIAVLALVRGSWQLWLLIAVFGVWGLWLVAAMLLPQMAAARRRKARRQYRTVPGAERVEHGTTEDILLRHVNYRISAYLKAVYPDARWEWRENQPERIVLHGGTGRIQIYGVPEFNYADVQLDPQANIQCSLVKIVPLSQTGDEPVEVGASSNMEPVDPQIWFEVQGRKVLEGLIADLHSRGHSSLTMSEDGGIHIEAQEEDLPYETLPSFPQKVYWPRLVKVLEREGYAADAGDDSITVSW